MPAKLALHQNYTNISWHASKAGTLSKQYKKVAGIPTKTELCSRITLSVDFGKYFQLTYNRNMYSINVLYFKTI